MSQVYTRASASPVGALQVKTAPVASSSVYYFKVGIVLHMVVTLEPSQLLLQCDAFSTTNAEKRSPRDADNCVVTGCGGYQCCVQQPNTFLNECEDSCLPGYTCLKNHTCV
jgi:hypothetical protein